MNIDVLSDLIEQIEGEVDDLIPPARVRRRLRSARRAMAALKPKQDSHPSLARRRLLLAASAAAAVTAIGGVQALLRPWHGRPAPALSSSTPPDGEDEVLWRVALGADGTMIGPADGIRVIVIAEQGVRAYSPKDGGLLWTKALTTRPASASRYGDRLVLSDERKLWALDAASGEQIFEVDLAYLEETTYRSDNPENATVKIRGALAAGDRLAVILNTAMVVIDGSGKTTWRVPRAVDDQGRRTTPPSPVFADNDHIICRESGSEGRITMRQVNDGAVVWKVPDAFNQQLNETGGVEGRVAFGIVVLRAGSEIQARSRSDGALLWRASAGAPVTAMETYSDLVLVAADRLVARSFLTGKQLWELPLESTGLAIVPPRNIIAVDGTGLAILDVIGVVAKRIPNPLSVRDATIEQLTVDGTAAYVIFRKPSGTRELIALEL